MAVEAQASAAGEGAPIMLGGVGRTGFLQTTQSGPPTPGHGLDWVFTFHSTEDSAH